MCPPGGEKAHSSLRYVHERGCAGGGISTVRAALIQSLGTCRVAALVLMIDGDGNVVDQARVPALMSLEVVGQRVAVGT